MGKSGISAVIFTALSFLSTNFGAKADNGDTTRVYFSSGHLKLCKGVAYNVTSTGNFVLGSSASWTVRYISKTEDFVHFETNEASGAKYDYRSSSGLVSLEAVYDGFKADFLCAFPTEPENTFNKICPPISSVVSSIHMADCISDVIEGYGDTHVGSRTKSNKSFKIE